MNIFYICGAIELIACSISTSALLLGWFGGASIYTPYIALTSGIAAVLFLLVAGVKRK